MKKKTRVVITTNYFCNYNCEYCYLGALRKDRKEIDIGLLRKNLSEIKSFYDIDYIDIIGGEPTLLNNLDEIIKIAKEYSNNVSLITNLSNLDKIKNYDIMISTSLNKERDHYDDTKLRLLINNKKNVNLNMVVTPSVINSNLKELLQELDQYGLDIDFLRYSPSVENKLNYNITNKEYANFLKEIIKEYSRGNYSFSINNIELLNEVIEHKYNPKMDAAIFISPYNNYSWISFVDEREFFMETSDFSKYLQQVSKEQNIYNKKCGKCKYYNRCYAEHLHGHRDNDICCGLKELIEWYEDIYKNNRKL